MISQESPTLAESRNLHADKIVLAAVTETAWQWRCTRSILPLPCFYVEWRRRKEGRKKRKGGREDYNEEEEGCVALLATKGRGGEAEGIQVKLIIFIKAFFL